MDTLNLDINKRYSYADYLSWMDDKRRELINGFVKLMTPAPARRHQGTLTNLLRDISYYLKNKKCKVYASPFDVRLPKEDRLPDEKIYDVVQPDICVICDKNKLDDRGCLGAPDLVIEIISPATSKYDLQDKYQLYERAGVTEYWIVYPHEKTISVFKLVDTKYQLDGMYAGNDEISPGIFKELVIKLEEVFDD